MTDSAVSGTALLSSRALIRLSGRDARRFLQGLISNDMAKAAPDRALYAALLTPQGKFLFDFFVIQEPPPGEEEEAESFLLECEAARHTDLLKRLTLYKLRAAVTLSDISADRQVAVVMGAAAQRLISDDEDADRDVPGHAWPAFGGIAYVDPRLARLGVRLVLPRKAARTELERAGLTPLLEDSAYARHRLALGVPEGHIDIQPDKAFLLESNFDELNGVDHHKGCYIGQETTSRTKRKGRVRKRLLPIRVDGPLPDPGTPIEAGEMTVGTVRGGVEQRAIALIHLERAERAQTNGVALTAGGVPVTVEVPDWLSRVSPLEALGP